MTAEHVRQLPLVPPADGYPDIPTPSLIIAACVVTLATFALARITWQSARERSYGSGAEPVRPRPGLGLDREPDDDWSVDVHDPHKGPVAFLVALGRAMLDSGASVTQVDTSLRRVARVNGLERVGVVVLPTALFVSAPGEKDLQTSVASAGGGLRLDQVDAVFHVVDAAARGEIGPDVGMGQLHAMRSMPPRYPRYLRLMGYPLLAAGLVLILRGRWLELLVAGVLATAVGALQLHRSRVPRAYIVFLPVVASFAVSLVVFLLIRAGLHIDVFGPLIAPLITLLPGALLTTAVIELATGQMTAGAGRLAQGGMQLVLLAIGIIAAGQLIGVPATSLADTSAPVLGLLAPWLGVGLFGVGVVLANSARPSSLPWIVIILTIAFAGQLLGGLLLGSQLSAFTGALLMTPFAMFADRHRSGPPALVTFLPAFWLLVPGALGLAGVTKYLGDNRVDGITSLVATGSTMIGIAFGILIGLAAGSLVGLASWLT